ncbi:hypothetical protein MKW92_016780 [Papaver armeniacum]|nr:hypothetical protein MKW92_016780 [Papaver armeniacum]
MGPIRGQKRKRKIVEKKVDRSGSGSGGGGSSSASSEKDEQPKDWWDEFSKRITGPLSRLKSSKKFESAFMISRKTFNYVCSLVKEDMIKSSPFSATNGKSLGLNDQVAVALRRLGSGESLVIIGETFGINQSSVSQITWRFIESMEKRGLLHLKWPSTEAEMTEVKSKFEKMRGLPNCCGAIDTTHIAMCLPTVDSSNDVWYDSENNHSMILQAIVDPDMRFRDIVTGWPGSVNESSALRSSGFFNLCEKGNRLSGKKIQLCEGSELREYIIGDVGFPLLPWLVTPYPGKHLSESKSEFNKRHFATRMEMWGILQGTIWRDTNRLPRIILVCCLLHNIVIDMEDEVQDEMPLTHHHDPGYKQQICDSVDKKASMLRDKLSLYLSGSLPP